MLMTAVRRSARLASKPRMLAEQRAHRNLYRRLDINDDDTMPIDDVLRDFITMFQGPLPEHIMAALTAIFGNDGDNILDEALLQHAGEAVADLHAADAEA
jgi:hypothetical protein